MLAFATMSLRFHYYDGSLLMAKDYYDDNTLDLLFLNIDSSSHEYVAFRQQCCFQSNCPLIPLAYEQLKENNDKTEFIFDDNDTILAQRFGKPSLNQVTEPATEKSNNKKLLTCSNILFLGCKVISG